LELWLTGLLSPVGGEKRESQECVIVFGKGGTLIDSCRFCIFTERLDNSINVAENIAFLWDI